MYFKRLLCSFLELPSSLLNFICALLNIKCESAWGLDLIVNFRLKKVSKDLQDILNKKQENLEKADSLKKEAFRIGEMIKVDNDG